MKRWISISLLTLFCKVGPLIAADPTRDNVQLAVEKGLFYVEQSAMNWWKTKNCVSCHHAPQLLFSHNIAKRQGFSIDQADLDFWTDRWVLVGGLVNNRKDGRKDGGGMLGAPLTLLFRDHEADSNSARTDNLVKLMQIAGNEWQYGDGGWDTKVGRDYIPWIALGLESFLDSDHFELSKEAKKEFTERAARTEAWIRKSDPITPEETEDIPAWLIYEHARGNQKRVDELLAELRDRQREDGLWGITTEAEQGHLLVTGTVLFGLTSIGLDTSDPLVAETQQLLLSKQAEDGR